MTPMVASSTYIILPNKRPFSQSYHAKSWLIGKDSDAGRDWGQEEKGMTEDEMAGWQHQLDGCESEWTLKLVMVREAWHAAIHGSQRVGHDWATELNWTECPVMLNIFSYAHLLFIYPLGENASSYLLPIF